MSRNRLIKLIHLAALLAILAIATNTLLALHLSTCHHEESSHQHDSHCQICKVLSITAGHAIDPTQTFLFAETVSFPEIRDSIFTPRQISHLAIIPRAPPVS